MPGPFPGMDPYLENPVLWPGVHQGLISTIRTLLNTRLPPDYVADIGERVVLMAPQRNIYPDAVVFRQRAPLPPSLLPPARESGGVAVAEKVPVEASDEPYLLRVEPGEVREVFVEVRPVGDESRVVAVIEVLSYVNKTPGQEARDRYVNKQQALLNSGTHLIEIDLLRTGEHTVAVPAHVVRREVDYWHYLVCLHRVGQNDFEVWPRTVRDRLPRIRVPLENNLADVVLDLQHVFDRNYDEGAYARRIDYRLPASVPVRPPDEDWADAWLRERGLRPQ